MKYYVVALDFTDPFTLITHFEGDILNEFEVKQKWRFCESDINNYFIPIKTSQRNIYRSFGKRKIKDWKHVKVLHKYESEEKMDEINYLELKLTEQSSTIHNLYDEISVLKKENYELTKKVTNQTKELKRLNRMKDYARDFAKEMVDSMITELIVREENLVQTIEALRKTNKMQEEQLKKIYEPQPESEEQND